ncbi:hypothetical protein ACH5RR_021758 [Cinchona calisaya]|uniref:Reverse transcriptase domain-containing protein n=1 Tax=Cinchona calisaya TaxID=153742 RepID=A0ABD2ZJ65_9GENT
MPFGLTNSPATFQSLMNDVFKNELRKFVFLFFDDILVYSKDWNNHVEHLRHVFGIAKEALVICKGEQVCLCSSKGRVLGPCDHFRRVAIDLAKIDSMFNWPRPWNLNQLRGF